MRFLQKKASETQQTFEEQLEVALSDPQSFVEFDPEVVKRLHEGLTPEARAYLHGRGFSDETIDYFQVGYSEKKDMLAVPVHSPNGLTVGLVGRGLKTKAFKNSKNLPRSKTLFNLHRAKRQGDIVIVTEASFDAMRVHQAGFPNVIGTLGGHLSPENFALLDRHFNTIIIMTDFDVKQTRDKCKPCHRRNLPACVGHNPGRDLGNAIAAGLRHKNILWAAHSNTEVYPHGAKDAGDLTDEEIIACVDNAKNVVEYASMGLY